MRHQFLLRWVDIENILWDLSKLKAIIKYLSSLFRYDLRYWQQRYYGRNLWHNQYFQIFQVSGKRVGNEGKNLNKYILLFGTDHKAGKIFLEPAVCNMLKKKVVSQLLFVSNIPCDSAMMSRLKLSEDPPPPGVSCKIG